MRLRAELLFYIPLPAADKERMIGKFVSVARATIKGTLVIGMVQGTLGGLALGQWRAVGGGWAQRLGRWRKANGLRRVQHGGGVLPGGVIAQQRVKPLAVGLGGCLRVDLAARERLERQHGHPRSGSADRTLTRTDSRPAAAAGNFNRR